MGKPLGRLLEANQGGRIVYVEAPEDPIRVPAGKGAGLFSAATQAGDRPTSAKSPREFPDPAAQREARTLARLRKGAAGRRYMDDKLDRGLAYVNNDGDIYAAAPIDPAEDLRTRQALRAAAQASPEHLMGRRIPLDDKMSRARRGNYEEWADYGRTVEGVDLPELDRASAAKWLRKDQRR